MYIRIGQKAQMEALSTHQELLLDSDSGNDKLGEDQKEDNSVNADDVNHEEFSSYTENDEALNKNRVGDVAVVEELSGNDVESSSNNDNVNNVAFLQEDIQSDSLLAVTSVAYGSSEIDSDVDSGFKDVNSGTEVLTSEPEMNDEPDNSPETKYDFSSEKFPVYDDSSSNYNSGYQDETADPPVNGIDDSSLHELGLVDKETVTESLEGVLNPGKTEQLLSEETGSTIEQQIGRGLSEAAFVSVTAYPLADDQEQNHETTMNSYAAEPELQGNLFSSAGVPAPLVSAAVKTLPGKVLVPAVVDQVQGQALAALQVLKVLRDAVPNARASECSFCWIDLVLNIVNSSGD